MVERVVDFSAGIAAVNKLPGKPGIEISLGAVITETPV
jgi:hypothetical protein